MREKLENYRGLINEIKDLERDIEKYSRLAKQYKNEVVVDAVKGSSIDFPYTKHTILIMGQDEEHYKKMSRMLFKTAKTLERRKERCLHELELVNAFIETIDKSNIRNMIKLYYIDGLTWQQVAERIGEHDESFPRRKVNEYLKLAENAETSVV